MRERQKFVEFLQDYSFYHHHHLLHHHCAEKSKLNSLPKATQIKICMSLSETSMLNGSEAFFIFKES